MNRTQRDLLMVGVGNAPGSCTENIPNHQTCHPQSGNLLPSSAERSVPHLGLGERQQRIGHLPLGSDDPLSEPPPAEQTPHELVRSSA